jgi:DNA processing protein
VEHPAQVLLELKIPFKKEELARPRRHSAAPATMDKASEMLLDAVGFEPATVDVLVVRTGLTGESIASMLLVLELQGHIASYPGGRYGRIP